MVKSFKVMLVPNNFQRTRLFQFAGTARFAYNWALQKEQTAYRSGEKFISQFDLRKEFTVLQNSKEYSWLKGILNNVTKQAIKDCCNAYMKFFKRLSSRPKFKSRHHGDFSFYQDTDKIRITKTHVKIEMISTSKKQNRQKLNWIRFAEVGRIPTDKKYQNPRVTFDGLNWWLSVTVEFESEKSYSDNESLGIDLGIKNLAVCSDGTIYPNINRSKRVKNLKKRQRRLQRSISRKYKMNNQKGVRYSKTCNIVKSERKLLKIHHRLANIRQNYRHQITSEIIKRKPSLIVLEDLNVRGMMSNRHLSKAVQEQGFFEFRRQIEYKARWAGIEVIIADRFYPSSKICICCGRIKKDLKLSERVYRCECGNTIDRDLQAAINLKRYCER
ncbi:MAG: transposase [Selenomonadaceae bacterium]|nr:transposase [Selenomonadaceae bacterium]